ncbi:MAG TPA: tetratricopeptide repeat protein [Polyangiaceae bacterium]
MEGDKKKRDVAKDDDEKVSEEESSDETSEESEDEAERGKGEDAEEEESSEEEAAEQEEDEEEDKASPEAIAKRVEAFGGEDESDRIAREEEQKLAERRRKLKKRGGKKGLELAASKKLSKIGKKARPTRAVPAAVEAADPLIERTQRFGEWAQKNAKLVWSVVGVAVVLLAGFGTYTYFDKKKTQDASKGLAAAVADERAPIGDPDKVKDDEDVPPLMFKTQDERRDSALSKYHDVATKYPGTGAATLARLGEGSLLLDKRDADKAIDAFADVKDTALAKADAEVRGRALEGLGFAYELRAQLKLDGRDKDLDAAIQAFRELEATDTLGFKELGMYHQARVYEAKGDTTKAKEILHALHDRLAAPDKQGHQLDALATLADDRLRRLDPLALPPKRVNYSAGGRPQLPPELLNQLPPELRAKLMGGGSGE